MVGTNLSFPVVSEFSEMFSRGGNVGSVRFFGVIEATKKQGATSYLNFGHPFTARFIPRDAFSSSLIYGRQALICIVLSIRRKAKVITGIAQAVSINVIDKFMSFKRPSQYSRHHHAMQIIVYPDPALIVTADGINKLAVVWGNRCPSYVRQLNVACIEFRDVSPCKRYIVSAGVGVERGLAVCGERPFAQQLTAGTTASFNALIAMFNFERITADGANTRGILVHSGLLQRFAHALGRFQRRGGFSLPNYTTKAVNCGC
jgi:hypothetical protein